MSGRARFLLLFALTLTVGFVFHADPAKAFDRVVISIPGGGTLLDLTFGEGGAAPVESLGLSAAGPSFGAPPAGFVPGFSIILTEPEGILEPPDPNPPVFMPDGHTEVSDVVLVDPNTQGLYFVSDGSQDFATMVGIALGLPLGFVAFEETGALQDLTPYLPGSPYQIQFLSDVPEPGTMALVSFGLLGMAVRARRVRS
jgi:hypothetical protein